MISATRAEVCAVACADLFRDAGEIMVSPMATIVSIGARLARLTFSPDILLTDGEARLLADTPASARPRPIEGWMPFGRVFETLAWGRRHVVMGANQIDRYGNQNISAFGPLQHPTRQMFGVRGAPGNTINHATSYWVPQPLHPGVRASRSTSSPASAATRSIPTIPAYRFHQRPPGRHQPRRLRLRRTRPPRCARCRCTRASSPRRCAENTVVRGARPRTTADTTRLPTADELELIREVLDPKALRDKEVKGDEPAPAHAADRAGRHRAPGRADRHGLGGRRAAGRRRRRTPAASASWPRRR